MQKSLQKKLDQFKGSIFEEIRQHNSEAIERSQRDEESILTEKEAELKQSAEQFYKTRMAQTDAAIHQMLSDAKISKNEAALALRKELLAMTSEALYSKAKSFVGSAAYQQLIKQRVTLLKESLPADQGLIISARREDQPFLKELLAAQKIENYQFDVLAKREIGGVIFTIPAHHIRYKITVKNMIDEKKDLIGARLYDLLEEMEE